MSCLPWSWIKECEDKGNRDRQTDIHTDTSVGGLRKQNVSM
jgi:hypothetical protein